MLDFIRAVLQAIASLFRPRNALTPKKEDRQTIEEMVEAEVPAEILDPPTESKPDVPEAEPVKLEPPSPHELTLKRLDAVLRHPAEEYERSQGLPKRYSDIRAYFGRAPKREGEQRIP